MGSKLTHTTSNPEAILGGNNDHFIGKLCILLKEMPVHSTGEWISLYNYLKQLITGDTIEIKTKYKDVSEIVNFLCFIIITNCNALKLETDDRCIFVLPISEEFANDKVCFTNLAACTDNDEVAEAFDWTSLEFDEENKTFKEYPCPVTSSSNNLVIDTLDSILNHIKQTYVQKRKPMNVKLSQLAKSVTLFCEKKKIQKRSYESKDVSLIIKLHFGTESVRRGTGGQVFVTRISSSSSQKRTGFIKTTTLSPVKDNKVIDPYAIIQKAAQTTNLFEMEDYEIVRPQEEKKKKS
jgi:hypothetical protein